LRGYYGDSIEDIADKNGLFLPGHNMPEKAEAEETTTREQRCGDSCRRLSRRAGTLKGTDRAQRTIVAVALVPAKRPRLGAIENTTER